MSVTAKVPGEQMMECMAKVEDYVPPIIPVPLWHELVFALLIFIVFMTPVIYLILWKLRQHKEPDDNSSEGDGSWHEDDTAAANLLAFKQMGGVLTMPHMGKRSL